MSEVIILPAPAPRTGMAIYWASRALDGDYGPLSDEDREMAEAASSRAMDVQLGIAGKGQVGHLRESFRIGDIIRREEEEAAAAVEDGALFGLGVLS